MKSLFPKPDCRSEQMPCCWYINRAICDIEFLGTSFLGQNISFRDNSLQSPMHAFMAGQLAVNLALDTGEKVILFTNGIDPTRIFFDALLRDAKVRLGEKKRRSFITEAQFARITKAAGKMMGLDIVVDDEPISKRKWKEKLDAARQDKVRHMVICLHEQLDDTPQVLGHLTSLSSTFDIPINVSLASGYQLLNSDAQQMPF